MSHAISKNTNCLEGIRCPRCKQQDLFYINARVEVDVTDNGTGDERGEYFWDDQSPCRCADDTCDRRGVLGDFRIENQKPYERPPTKRPRFWNGERAGWARTAVDAFVADTGTDEEDALCDLLCNLMHLADFEGWDFSSEYGRALLHYEAEQSER